MSNYLNYYEIQHTNTDFENLIHYLQDAVKENKLKITKEVVDTIIEITNKQKLFEDDLKKSHEEGYSEGYKDGEFDGKENGYDDGYLDGEFDGKENGYDDGYLDGYSKAKDEIKNPDIEIIKQKIADEKYREGYFIGYDHARRKWEPKIDNDDLPFS